MPNLEKNPNFFRLLIISIASFLIIISTLSFIRSVTSTTDENQWITLPAILYITNELQSEVSDTNSNDNTKFTNVKIGHLLRDINGIKISDTVQLRKALGSFKDNDLLTLGIINNILPIKYYQVKVTKSKLPQKFIYQLPSNVLIVSVFKDGGSYRAGLKEGDFILSINSITFKDGFDADKYLRLNNSEDVLHYKVLRNNQIIECDVELAKIGVSFSYLLILFVSFIYYAFGLFIGVKKPGIQAARLISISFILMGFLIYNGIEGRYFLDYDILTVLQFLTLSVCAAIGLPLIIKHLLYFPKELTDLIRKQWIWIIPFIIGGIYFISSNIFYIFFLNISNTSQYSKFFLIYALTMILFGVVISIIFRKYTTKESKKISRFIRYTFFFMLVCFVYSAFFERIYTLIFETQYLRMALFPEILPIAFLLIPLAYIYTIGKYSLLDMTIRVPKNIQYMLLSSLWKLVFFCIILLGIWGLSNWKFNFPNIKLTGTSLTVLNSPLSPELQDVYSKMLIILISLFGVFVFWLLNKGFKNLLDKKFYRLRFDYRRAATEFSEIFNKGTISELSASISKELKELYHLKRIGVILFKNEETVIAQDYLGFDYKQFFDLCKESGKKLSETIKEFHGEFRIEYLYEPIKTIFHEYKFCYVVPIRSKDKVEGAVLLGEKLSEKSFTREDFNLLNAILSQASIAIENTFLVEDCTLQERLKHELEIARRIQIASLPQKVPQVRGLDISGVSNPALEVGGDFFDFLNGKPDEITVIVGDVSGKGTSAALYMSKIQGILRTLNEFMLNPRDLFIRANQLLYKYLEKDTFVTVVAAKFDSKYRKVKIARAGHLPIYYYKSLDSSVEKILPKGILLGKSKNEIFDENIEEIQLNYHPGDVFLFISDGVIEARNNRFDDFDEMRLMDTFKKNIENNSEKIRDNIVDTVSDFSNEVEPYDDLTIVVVKAKVSID
ncbi:MAG: SpoIIE family protein phosphatase [Ignavibacteriae bacterium]|nr:SpoIIE family protein phosphatase [Ignavibacteriota bacterium]